jgi:heat shock protein HslJ
MKSLTKLGVFILTIGALGFIGKSGATTQAQLNRAFDNVTWVLEQIGSSRVGANPPELSFDRAKGLVSGSTGINRLHAHYALTGQELTFSSIATTRRIGTEEAMDLEARFLHRLERVNGWRIKGDNLELLRNGLLLLKFAHKPASP